MAVVSPFGLLLAALLLLSAVHLGRPFLFHHEPELPREVAGEAEEAEMEMAMDDYERVERGGGVVFPPGRRQEREREEKGKRRRLKKERGVEMEAALR